MSFGGMPPMVISEMLALVKVAEKDGTFAPHSDLPQENSNTHVTKFNRDVFKSYGW